MKMDGLILAWAIPSIPPSRHLARREWLSQPASVDPTRRTTLASRPKPSLDSKRPSFYAPSDLARRRGTHTSFASSRAMTANRAADTHASAAARRHTALAQWYANVAIATRRAPAMRSPGLRPNATPAQKAESSGGHSPVAWATAFDTQGRAEPLLY